MISVKKNVLIERAILVTLESKITNIIMKVARCGIPVSVPMRMLSSSSIYTAELTGITLICFTEEEG
ncbi:MAG: hypothetical protein NWE86_00275 [Candidatus Bathyarchaeota archaeon]|nr:hypothetical protein [Candidatus Bathyarchaeota archaeon]